MESLRKTVVSTFFQHFDGEPILIKAPGRVNLIGEHTDYNMGFVLPAAIDKSIILAMSRNDQNMIRLFSLDMSPSYVEIPVNQEYEKTEFHWANYILGVVDEIQKTDRSIGGFDCVFGGDLPIGAGLSSSAALEGGVAYGLSILFDLQISQLDMTVLAQKAENNFIGVQCGIMDQFASLHGKNSSVIKLDCRSLDFKYYPFNWDDVCILLCDTKVRRTLKGSEYNVRRAQCETGVAVIHQSDPNVKSLRDVTPEQLASHKHELDEIVYRRCAFILNENNRVNQACDDLLRSNLVGFGEKMYQSHYGLRDEYEVSCKELDILVEATEQLDGVLGSRMMGGGFGGCTINLVKIDKLEEIQREISSFYLNKTGIEPEFHAVNIGQGTHMLTDQVEMVK